MAIGQNEARKVKTFSVTVVDPFIYDREKKQNVVETDMSKIKRENGVLYSSRLQFADEASLLQALRRDYKSKVSRHGYFIIDGKKVKV